MGRNSVTYINLVITLSKGNLLQHIGGLKDMVYVLNINKKPLMPCTEAKARKLLKQNKAKIVKRNPFTIQLLFECEDKTQPVNLGFDAGSKHIGVSANTEKKVLYEADVYFHLAENKEELVEIVRLDIEKRDF